MKHYLIVSKGLMILMVTLIIVGLIVKSDIITGMFVFPLASYVFITMKEVGWL